MGGNFLDFMTEVEKFDINILLLLGLALFGGTVGGQLFKKIKIPQVVGYIFVGIILGQSGINLLDKTIIATFKPFNYFALGIIGFMIGGELKQEVIAKFGKQFIVILLLEGLVAYFSVVILTYIAGMLIFDNTTVALPLALLLGSIASATAPAATTDVLWEYKTKGPLTTILTGIVAMDDALALTLFAISASFANSLLGHKGDLFMLFFKPVYEIGGAVILGVLAGYFLRREIKRFKSEDKILTFSIGVILLMLGIASSLLVDVLLTAMVIGTILVNYKTKRSNEIFKLVEKFTPPIYILFFVLFGAGLNVEKMDKFVIIIAGVYLIGRTLGKMFGAYLGGRLSKAPETVTKYLPFCLFSQAGVAIGLSLVAGQSFHSDIGNTIVIVITLTTFLVQLFGPISTKWAVTKAGEVGLNITEDDIIKDFKVKDVMDKKVPRIFQDMSLREFMRIFIDNDYLEYPVVDGNNKLTGIIKIENIKNSFVTPELEDIILAFDLMEKVRVKAYPEEDLKEVKELFNLYNINIIPVVDKNMNLLGVLGLRNLNKTISIKVVELQNKVNSLMNYN